MERTVVKLTPNILFIALACIGAAPVAGAAATLLTFDELPTPEVLPGLNYGSIADGYGTLLWDNFGVLDGSNRPGNEGYHSGIVSPNNVAFNLYGSPASISMDSGSFNLGSAYLTAALDLDTALDIQVQGFIGESLVYDHTYTVYRSAPALIDFNYAGVDRVTFASLPAQPFAMDNLTITVPEPGAMGLMVLGAAVIGAAGSSKRRARG